jgi:hypothetical protein
MKEEILHSQLKNVELFGDFKSHKAEIDAEDLSWILQILSTNLYSDPIGSLIREYSSNAWDANIEAGNKDKPIEVGLQTSKDQGSYWYVTDLGPGLSPERIDGIYRKFGKSTKRDSNEAIGMMGLGKFSGLSYSNEIYITTRVDGREYEYLMHKSEGTPQIDLLIDRVTTNPNGTTIKVFIANYYDKRKFKDATLEQLAYFENVYYNIDDMPSLNQDIKLIKAKTFTYSSTENRELRIKLGPVTYPIDSNSVPSIGNSFLYMYRGLAINFNIGELAITPNRESILYNKKTIETIENRVQEFRNELVEIYNSKGQEYEKIGPFIEALNSYKITIGNSSYTVPTNLASLIKPRLKGLDIDIRASYITGLFPNYSVHADYNGSRRSKEYNHSFNPELNDKIPFLLADSIALEPKKLKYIYETNVDKSHTGKQMKIIKYKKAKLKHYEYNDRLAQNCYYYLLSLDTVPKAKWRETIKKFQEWQKNYVEKLYVDYNKVNVPKAWLDAQKTAVNNNNAVALRTASGKILMYFGEKSNRWGGIASFNGKDVLISKLEKQHNFIIYAEELFKDELKKAYSMLYNYSNIKVVVTAEKNHKYLKLFPNYIHVTEFLKGNNKYFRKCVGAYVLRTMYGRKDQFYSSRDLLQYLNKETYDKFIELHKESNTLQSNYERNVNLSNQDKFEHKEFMDKAIAEGKVDYGYLDKANKFKAIQDEFEFITLIKPNGSYNYYYEKAQKDFAVWTAKHKKVKLSLTHYQKKEDDTRGSEDSDVSEDTSID